MSSLKSVLKKIILSIGLQPSELKGQFNGFLRNNVIENYFKTNYSRNALISYIIVPFKTKTEMTGHQNLWQALELAKQISDRGYNVDIIPYYDPYVHLRHKYDLVLAQFPKDTDCYSNYLNSNAIKIAYLTTSSPEFNNTSELERISRFEKRRGKCVKPMRQLPDLSEDFYSYDAYFVMGNTITASTYNLDSKKIFYIVNNASKLIQPVSLENKKSTNFLFLGSVGQVHKGLDILLEVFAKDDFPCDLYILGAYEHERDFYEEYEAELNAFSNIHSEGFVEITSPRYKELCEKCAYMIMPSCSEGMAGSVLDAMAGGMIPIVSKYCGFDESDGAIVLKDCSVDSVKQSILEYSKKTDNWIMDKSREIVAIAEEKYSREKFSQSVRNALNATLDSNRF